VGIIGRYIDYRVGWNLAAFRKRMHATCARIVSNGDPTDCQTIRTELFWEEIVLLPLILDLDPNPETMPVSSDLLDNLREAVGSGEEGYDIDEVLYCLALAIFKLETSLIDHSSSTLNLKADLLILKTDFLNSGLRIR
jgi:hypothetical protein